MKTKSQAALTEMMKCKCIPSMVLHDRKCWIVRAVDIHSELVGFVREVYVMTTSMSPLNPELKYQWLKSSRALLDKAEGRKGRKIT